MSSHSGTKSTVNKERSLSADEICRIIKACKTSGISELEYKGLQIKFHPYRNEDAVKPGQASDNQIVYNYASATSNNKEQLSLLDEEALIEAEEAQLLIDDPAAYERSQIRRHVEVARG